MRLCACIYVYIFICTHTVRVENSGTKLVLLIPNVYPTTLRKKMAFCAKATDRTWPKTLSHFKEIKILDRNIPTCDLNTYSRAEPKRRQTTRSEKQKKTHVWSICKQAVFTLRKLNRFILTTSYQAGIPKLFTIIKLEAVSFKDRKKLTLGFLFLQEVRTQDHKTGT